MCCHIPNLPNEHLILRSTHKEDSQFLALAEYWWNQSSCLNKLYFIAFFFDKQFEVFSYLSIAHVYLE